MVEPIDPNSEEGRFAQDLGIALGGSFERLSGLVMGVVLARRSPELAAYIDHVMDVDSFPHTTELIESLAELLPKKESIGGN